MSGLYIFLDLAFFAIILTSLYKIFHWGGIKAKKTILDFNSDKEYFINRSNFVTLDRFNGDKFYSVDDFGYSVSKLMINPWINPHYSFFIFNIKSKGKFVVSNYDPLEVFYYKESFYSDDGVFFSPESSKEYIDKDLIKKHFNGKKAFVEFCECNVLFGFRGGISEIDEVFEVSKLCKLFIDKINF